MEGVHYSFDGEAHIAFREVVGNRSSDITVLLCSGQLIPLELMWADHGHARFVDGLASLGRLIVFDRRGIGMSDPITNWDEPLFEQWLADAVSVLDTAGVESAHVMGWEQGGSLAFGLGARHPQRVSGLAVLHGIDRLERLERAGLSPTELATSLARWIQGADDTPHGAADGYSYATSRTGDMSLRSWLDQAGRLGASPMVAARIWQSVLTDSIPTDLGDVTCPTLLLWRRDNGLWSPEIGRAMAAEYPRLEYVELPGQDFAPYSGDIDGLVSEIERFVTGDTSRTVAADRRLAAVLFSDVVGSTESLRSVGDGAWRGTLDAHDRIVDRVVNRHRGTVVKHAGDGSLLVFDLVSRALRAATDLGEQLAAIDLPTRQGVHVGEVMVRGEDISGVAVHIASRIMSLAKPGEILTSAAVPMVVEGDSFVFRCHGEVGLRGLPGEWEIYSVES